MSGKSLLAVLTALTLAGSSGCQTSARNSSAGFFSGRTERAAGDQLSPEFLEARKTFRRNTPKALLAWARYQEDVGEYAEALRRYRELTIAYPENIEAHLGLARVENTTGRFEQAEEILKKLAAEHPDSTQVRLELGQLYSQREDWNSATLAFEQACRLAPHDQTCRYELGVAMARNGLIEQALPHLTFAVGGPAAHYNIGYLLHEQRRDGEAEEWLRQALTMHPDQKTADQSRRLLAQLASEGNSAVATSGAKRGSTVRAAGASQDKRVDAYEAESAGGVQQAAWFEEGRIESRLRGMGEDRPGPVDVQPSELSSLPSAGAISLPRNKGAQRGSAVPSGQSGQSGSSLPKPLEPPVWKSARPVDR